MKKITLSNGLTVLYRQTPQDPIAAGHLFLPTGSAFEPESKWGMSSLLWSLFSKGTQEKSAREFSEQVESIGAYIGAGATLDYAEISFHTASEQMGKAMSLMSEALLHPALRPEELEKEKGALIANLKSKQENPFTIAHEKMTAALFPSHPYGRPSGGSEETIHELRQDDIENWHRQTVSPRGAVLSFAADKAWEIVEPIVEKLFGQSKWTATSSQNPPKISDIAFPQTRVHLRSLAPFEQACLLMGFPAPAVGLPGYTEIKVLNTVLGGGMSNRLFQSLREKQGLAYDVGSYYPSRKQGSAFVLQMGLQPDKLPQAKQGIQKELDMAMEKPITEEELTRAKKQIRGSFILDHQTNSQRSHYAGWWEILGLGWNYEQTYLDNVVHVTAQGVQETAKNLFSRPPVIAETLPEKKQESLAHAT